MNYFDNQWMDRGVIDSMMEINKEIDEKENGSEGKAVSEELTKLYNKQLMKSLQLQYLPYMGMNNIRM